MPNPFKPFTSKRQGLKDLLNPQLPTHAIKMGDTEYSTDAFDGIAAAATVLAQQMDDEGGEERLKVIKAAFLLGIAAERNRTR